MAIHYGICLIDLSNIEVRIEGCEDSSYQYLYVEKLLFAERKRIVKIHTIANDNAN